MPTAQPNFTPLQPRFDNDFAEPIDVDLAFPNPVGIMTSSEDDNASPAQH